MALAAFLHPRPICRSGKIKFLQAAGDRPRFAVADRLSVDGDNREDSGRRGRQKSLAGLGRFGRRERPLDNRKLGFGRGFQRLRRSRARAAYSAAV